MLPDYLPDTADIRQDLAEFYGSITVADAAVGQLLDALAATGLDRTTWVVFVTDHGPALPRAKSTLYDAGTGIAMIVRPPRGAGLAPQVYDELFSGVDLVPTLLELLGVDVPAEIEGHLPRRQRCAPRADNGTPVRSEVYTTKTYHDSFDPIRAIRTKEYSYIENYASAATAGPAVGHRRQRARMRRRATGRWPAAGARTLRPARRPDRIAQSARPGRNRQGRSDRQRPRAAAQRLAAEDQRRHPVRLRRNPDRRPLHPDLSRASTDRR